MTRLVIVDCLDVPLHLSLDLPEDFQLCLLVSARDVDAAPEITEYWFEGSDAEPLSVSSVVRAQYDRVTAQPWPSWLRAAYDRALENAEEARVADGMVGL